MSSCFVCCNEKFRKKNLGNEMFLRWKSFQNEDEITQKVEKNTQQITIILDFHEAMIKAHH
jgi:hypothetical protein